VFADWYHLESIQRLRFYDDNTRSWWEAATGGANVPALNDLLVPFGAAFEQGEAAVLGVLCVLCVLRCCDVLWCCCAGCAAMCCGAVVLGVLHCNVLSLCAVLASELSSWGQGVMDSRSMLAHLRSPPRGAS
jgi:hypothetical protein